MEEIADIQNLNVVGESKRYIVIKLDDEYYGIDISYCSKSKDHTYTKGAEVF